MTLVGESRGERDVDEASLAAREFAHHFPDAQTTQVLADRGAETSAEGAGEGGAVRAELTREVGES